MQGQAIVAFKDLLRRLSSATIGPSKNFFFVFFGLDQLRCFKSAAIALRKTRTYCGYFQEPL